MNSLFRVFKKMPSQRGFSLVEIVVSMTGGAAIFCLAIATLEQTMKLSKESRARAEHQSSVARLGQQFRSDVHQVSEFVLETQNDIASPNAVVVGRIEPSSPDTARGVYRLNLKRSEPAEAVAIITYVIDGSTITREVTKPDSQTKIHETYRLHKLCSARFESADAQHLTLLILRHPPDGGEMLDNRIVARAGRMFSVLNQWKGQ